MSGAASTQPQMKVERPSLASLLVQGWREDVALGPATAFVVERSGSSWLVTNRHVVTGLHNQTHQPLSYTGAVPDTLHIKHNVTGPVGATKVTGEALYGQDGEPRWLEHPEHGSAVDVVALELAELHDVVIYAHELEYERDVLLRTTTVLRIVGYPFAIGSSDGFAIWSAGTVASEPADTFNGMPAFLVDSRTRPGQSGSPVIFYATGGSVMFDEESLTHGKGTLSQLIGVYSGRISEESDLGIVWRRSVIGEIIDGGVPGSTPIKPHY